MLKLSEPRLVSEADYEELKNLWQTSFDDSREVLDSFFDKTVSPGEVVAIFEGEKAVSALYLLPYRIICPTGQSFYAYYVYGVCTHPDYRGQGLMKKLFDFADSYAEKTAVDYLFLVPAEKSLFSLYEKAGFKTGFCYEEKTVYSKDFLCESIDYTSAFTYEDYLSFAINQTVTVAVPDSKAFKSFYSSVSGECNFVYIPEKGFALFEVLEGKTVVRELYGDEEALLACVFREICEGALTVRKPCEKGEGIAYGMYKKILDCPDIKNGFFGMPYAT